MIVECTGCGTTYKIAEDKVPPDGVKVRCPKCRVVFKVQREVETEPETLGEKLFGKDIVHSPLIEEKVVREEAGAEVRQAETSEAGAAQTEAARAGTGEAEAPSRPGALTEAETREKTTEPEPPEKMPPPHVEQKEPAPPEVRKPEERRPDERTQEADGSAVKPEAPSFPFKASEEDPRNLARALVSDILFYNREKRDKGLAEGKVLACLGREIARSWELYKDRVGIQKAIGTDYFREAVNEILGGDEEII